MIPKVYAYSEPHLFLRDTFRHKQKHNRLFSIRAWSKQMGFQCHSSLVFFLNGKRPLRPEHVERLNRGLRLEGNEEKYFRLLVQRLHLASIKDREDCESQLRLLSPSPEESFLETEKFKSIADWLHMAILEMTHLKDFQSEAAWIAARLKFPVAELQVQEAIERLLQLGLLEWQAGRLIKTQGRLTTPKDRASESIREHHRQVLANATLAIDQQGTQERVLNACTFTIDASKLDEAKDLILKFRADMAKLMEKKDGDETYQLAVQFFKLTENSPPLARKTL